ncbi:myb-like DNA-binding domain-containing protein [Ditylenchus destructor]|uniref:Myb-like DNA-binding domain-containing protein n=1 Tax=Ditylenchus destructor TaxID=166010 RepID=A0AAD4R464_9BILA|nr:myb-like DNA-binding domain-containing protein [Ditylenchus destructor]
MQIMDEGDQQSAEIDHPIETGNVSRKVRRKHKKQMRMVKERHERTEQEEHLEEANGIATEGNIEPEVPITKKKKKRKRKERTDDDLEEQRANPTKKRNEDVNYAYNYIERREMIDTKIPEDIHQLAGIYSAQMLNYTRPSEPNFDDYYEDSKRAILKLPADGGIFIDGIPFHHYVLTALKDKHLERLRRNGIEINRRQFNSYEDRLIKENWRTFSEHHNISLDQAPLYMSAATAHEDFLDHKERITFCRTTLFRPWMCKRLLDRTCVQVFRRCYVLFHCANLGPEDNRTWTTEDDKRLMELVEQRGKAWESIGAELNRTRFACQKRYENLNFSEENSNQGPWEPIEIARFYLFLKDNMARNPVLVATIPKYEKYENDVKWDSEELDRKKLNRSITQRQQKWQELKMEFREAKERLNTDIIKEVERAVIPESVLVLAHVKSITQRKYLPVSAEQMAQCIDVLNEQELAEKIRHFNLEQFWNKVFERNIINVPEHIHNPYHRIFNRIRYMVHVFSYMGFFKTLPIEEDTLKVRLEIISHVLRKAYSYKIKKKKIRKYVRRFIRAKGWEPRKQIVFVDNKDTGENDEENE